MHVIKKIIIIITLFQIILPNCVCGEDIPKSYFIEPIDVVCDYPFNDTTKWAVTCRVWGLLKYFHPNVTAGKFDWDEVLINSLGKINEAGASEQVNTELMNMIRIAGAYEFEKDPVWNDSLNMNVDLCWLDHSFINDSVRQELKKIASLSTTNHWYYIKPSVGHESPNNEKDYDKDVILRYEYRLLALFRYWNVIYYFYPYKYLMDQSWDVTLFEYIPRFLNTCDVLSYYNTVQQLATRLNDGHGFTTAVPMYYDSSKFKYITLIDSLTIVRKPPEGSLLERGDIFLSIDEKDINMLRDSIASLIPSSNKLFTENVINGFIYHAIMKGCMLSVKRNQQVINYREYWKNKSNEIISDSTFYIISPDIRYVNLDLLKASDIPSMMDSLKYCKGVVFDLRNYLKQLTFWDLLPYLIETLDYTYALATLADWSHLGAFYKYECKAKFPDELLQGFEKYTGKIAVLINESTMSIAETWAMTFKIQGIMLVGTPTAGANGNIAKFSLPGSINVYFSGLGFYYPNGEQTQRKGIIPDIEVYPTMDDIMAGRDEVLEAAIAYLNSN